MDKRGLNMHIVLGHARVVETYQIKVHPAQFHFQLSHRKMQGKSIGTGEHASLQHLANNLLRWGVFLFTHFFLAMDFPSLFLNSYELPARTLLQDVHTWDVKYNP